MELAQTTPDDKVLLVDEALARLKEEDPELERIVVLKFFGGLSNEEIAETLGLAPPHAGPAVGLCQGLAVSLYQRAEVNTKKVCIILAKVVCLCRIRGQWTNEYSSPARKGGVC